MECPHTPHKNPTLPTVVGMAGSICFGRRCPASSAKLLNMLDLLRNFRRSEVLEMLDFDTRTWS
jgi:hypothetical protein